MTTYDDYRRAAIAVEMAEAHLRRARAKAEAVERLWLGIGPAVAEILAADKESWGWGGSTAD